MIIIQPAFGNSTSRRNVAKTLDSKIQFVDEPYASLIPEGDMSMLLDEYPGGGANFWAVTANQRSKFQEIEVSGVEELVLFTGQGHIRRIGRTGCALTSVPFGNAMWEPHPEKGPYLHIYTIDDIEDVLIPYAALREALGRPDGGDNFMGMRLVRDDQIAQRVERLVGGTRKVGSRVPSIGSGKTADIDLDVSALEQLLDQEEDLVGKADMLPLDLPPLGGEPSAEISPEVNDEEQDDQPRRGRTARGRTLDKFAEKRAIKIARAFMQSEGWSERADRQADGVGYDLEFEKAADRRHVEVKGIQGKVLRFNVTALEWARVLSDPLFVVIAVTSVLDADNFHVHVVTRDRLANATRQPVQYRLRIE